MGKKERIQQLKKNNRSFAKGAGLTKLTVVMSLLLIFALHLSLFYLSQEINEVSLIHMGVQVLTVLLMLSGKVVFPLGYLLAMAASLAAGIQMYLSSESLFYLVQCVFFGLSAVLMLNLLLNRNAGIYRRELKNLGKREDYSFEKIEEDDKPEKEKDETAEEADETVLKSERNEVEVLCGSSVDFSYGSFSRFLVQHYPFVYLHPGFSTDSDKIQMCIAAEGFEKNSDELYSGEFRLLKKQTEQGMLLHLAYEDEMGCLCALICADWLMAHKALLIENGSDASADLMERLTKAFVAAQNADKRRFEGFQK